jgi:hypothetical protein
VRTPGLVEREVLAVEVDAEVREELVEEAAPRARAGQVLLRRDPLLGLRELVRLVPPLRPEHVRVLGERRVDQQSLGDPVVEPAPLEIEEEELGLDLRVPLAHLLHEGAAGLVGAVGREPEASERLDAGRDGLEPLQLDDGLVQLGRGELAEPAAVTLAEGGRGGGGLVELVVDPRVVRPLEEVVKVPLDVLRTGDSRGHGETLQGPRSLARGRSHLR